MTGVIIGDEINILSIKDGIATVEKKQAEVVAVGGLSGLSDEARKKLTKEYEREREKVDGYNPSMEGTGRFILGGDPNSKVILQKPLAEILTRNEKREYAKAMRLHNQGRYGMLLQKYGTDNIKTIKRILYKQLRTTARYQGLRFTAEGMKITAPRAREELRNE